MIRRYFLFGLMFFLVTVSSFAQYEQTGGFARLRGMGNNPYIVDPYFMTVNPAWGGHYQNFLFGDLGSQTTPWGVGGSGQFIAANFHLGGGLSLGAMLTRNDFGGLSISRLDPLNSLGEGPVNAVNGIIPGAVISLNNNVAVFGSYKSGGTAFGLGVAYAGTTNEFTPAGGDPTTGSASQFGVNVGIVTKLTGSFMLDLGASLIMPSASYEPAVGNTTESSQTIILANARIFWNYSSKLAFVPSVGFLTASGTVDNGTTATTTSTDVPSYTVISVGLGTNYNVGDFLLAGGLGFATASRTVSSTETSPELSTSFFVFPIWNLGVEWNMNDWLVARFGYVATTSSITTETDNTGTPEIDDINEAVITAFGGPYGQSSVGGGATVGVGFRLGNFSLDATVNEDVLRQGLNNLGGNGGSANTFAYLSLAYAMP